MLKYLKNKKQKCKNEKNDVIEVSYKFTYPEI